MDHRPGHESTDACSPATPLSAGTVAATDPAPGGGRSPTYACMVALGRYLVRAVAADGTVPGLARCLLAGLYAAVLLNGVRGGDALAIPIMVLVFLALYAWVLGDWREALLVLFAPDASLWRPPTGWSWLERLGMAACRHAVLWLVVPFLCAGLPCRPEGILPLPLLASVMQRALERVRQRLRRQRFVRLPRGPGCDSALDDELRDTAGPGDAFFNNAVTDRVNDGGPHVGRSARTAL